MYHLCLNIPILDGEDSWYGIDFSEVVILKTSRKEAKTRMYFP